MARLYRLHRRAGIYRSSLPASDLRAPEFQQQDEQAEISEEIVRYPYLIDQPAFRKIGRADHRQAQ